MIQIKRRTIATLLCCCSALFSAATVYASNDLPELGTVAGSTLSIDQENEIGGIYMRLMRSQLPLVTDPVLTEYLDDIGHRIVAYADNVKTPFQFFLVNNNTINAFAFFGGHVGVHSALFLYADNESELASVLAHEIAHVTQRHLARSIEAQRKNTPATVAGVLGSIILAMAAPEAGIAALQSTLALGQQAQINYTRSNEQEADRIGMRSMVAAGFDANAVPSFFGKMAAQYRFATKPPAMLLTHPLPESRIADSRNRAARYPPRRVDDSLLFRLAKARVQVRYSDYSADRAIDIFTKQLASIDQRFRAAAEYGLVLAYLKQDNLTDAKPLISKLLNQDPQNLFYLDSYADVMLASGQHQLAIDALQAARKNRPNNAVIEINLANSYLEQGQIEQAQRLLEQLQILQPQNSTVLSLLSTVYRRLELNAQRYLTQAELLALRANYELAIDQLQHAYRLSRQEPLQLARIDARIKQMRLAQQQLQQFK
ncbi:M48 family metalloprotease [uncultured Ferrimonas sp.]|uniref:beta-barrel assembly-enhancing protease n=1 Tax=uncultured Ferrimonas sp. TaxID=432640 RepID=UPI0026380F36|nr:M48 family metalloprotease [uncultured Ferrimonas sp.]